MQSRVMVITGASSGIGAALARAVADTARLVLVARRADRLQALARELRAQGTACLVLAEDLTDPTAAARCVEATLEAFGELHVLVNNAGAFVMEPASQVQAAGLDALWALNVRAPMLLTAAALPALRAAQGQIVTISSIVTERSFAGCSAYTASKEAIEGWSRCLREEERANGVRVSVVAPGATDTEIFSAVSGFDRSTMMRADQVAAVVRQMIDAPPGLCVERLVVLPPAGTQ